MMSKKLSDTKDGKLRPHVPLGIEELSGFVYSGNKQGNQYNWTTRALADYCGSQMSPGVWELIMNGVEAEIKEPTGKVTECAKVSFCSWWTNG
jgi:hypothetical protein